jgi:hypothetical protein
MIFSRLRVADSQPTYGTPIKTSEHGSKFLWKRSHPYEDLENKNIASVEVLGDRIANESAKTLVTQLKPMS